MIRCLRMLVLGLFGMVQMTSAAEGPEKLRVYIGSYSSPTSLGIYLSELDLATGALTDAKLAGKVVSPSFLAIHPTRKFLYAVSEISNRDGKKTGGVSAFAIAPASGELTLLNAESSEGAGPCHVSVDPAGKNVLVANYGGGSVASYHLGDDGKLSPAVSAIQHQGSSVNPQRQKEPHAHSFNFDLQGKYAFAADLGLDQVLIYQVDGATGKLTPNDPPFVKVAPGAGPRHFAFHPSGKYAYVINEMGNTVTAFAYDGGQGRLTEMQTISTLPANYQEVSHTAEVVVHPSGKFVYGSNRGHDSLAVYSVEDATGKLTLLEIAPTGGKTPRNFNVDPTGQFVLVGNQDDDTISVHRIGPDGNLKLLRNDVRAPKPVCIKFVAP